MIAEIRIDSLWLKPAACKVIATIDSGHGFVDVFWNLVRFGLQSGFAVSQLSH